ncbi:hypothetical protein Tco_0599014 [Tanacetum coccineum]
MEIFRSRVMVKIRVMEETMREFRVIRVKNDNISAEMNNVVDNSYASEAIDYVNNINVDVNVVVQKLNVCASKVMENAVDEITNVSSTMNNAKNDIIMLRMT